ncbi:hypothetical protein [Shewanella vesiculosa]|uniref:hypothetical protein n=1 Tax=Shewanella vesiculosa TaxID=518738 RepID=UPI000F4FAA17|nr:hypothetical protein [Shewanella vesiculosa]
MSRTSQRFQFRPLLPRILLTSMLIVSHNTQGNSEMNEPVQCSLNTTSKIGQLQFSVSNAGTTGWQFLSWNTPFDAWFSQFMTITRGGTAIEYQGALAKRAKPQSEDFIQLNPMQTVIAYLDLTQAYRLTPGHYKITLSPIVLEALPTNMPTLNSIEQPSYKLQCNSLMLEID